MTGASAAGYAADSATSPGSGATLGSSSNGSSNGSSSIGNGNVIEGSESEISALVSEIAKRVVSQLQK
jgi:hypothetical protein